MRKQIFVLTLAGFLIMTQATFAGETPANGPAPGNETTSPSPPPTLDQLMETGDRLFAQRDRQDILLFAIAAYEEAYALAPENEAVLRQLSRAYYWKGENIDPDEKGADRGKMAAHEKGMLYGEQYLALFPDSAAAHFWYASNMARFGAAKGILKSLSTLSDLREHIGKVLELDKFYYDGGPQRFLAKLIVSVPGLLRKTLAGGDLDDAKKMLDEAIAHQPDFTLSYVFLGEILMKQKQKEKALACWQKVLSIPETALPQYAPENRRDKQAAERLLQEYTE